MQSNLYNSIIPSDNNEISKIVQLKVTKNKSSFLVRFVGLTGFPKEDRICSPVIELQGSQWQVFLCFSSYNCISCGIKSSNDNVQRLSYSITIVNQMGQKNYSIEQESIILNPFGETSLSFISRQDFYRANSGYIVSDILILRVDIITYSEVENNIIGCTMGELQLKSEVVPFIEELGKIMFDENSSDLYIKVPIKNINKEIFLLEELNDSKCETVSELSKSPSGSIITSCSSLPSTPLSPPQSNNNIPIIHPVLKSLPRNILENFYGKKNNLSLYSLQNENINTDSFLNCKKSETHILFPVHKFILRLRSPVFYKMLHPDSNFEELKKNEMEISDFSVHAIKLMIEYFYTDKIDNKYLLEFGWELLGLSNKYEINSLKAYCQDFLVKNIDSDNVIYLLSLCELYSTKILMEYCLQYISLNYRKMSNQSDKLFELLSIDLCKHVLKLLFDAKLEN